MAYRVLVVDDSAFMRKVIRDLVESDPAFEVVGTARNGVDAIDKRRRLNPDVVTMDVEMPEMDGLTAVRVLMRECPVAVVMMSTLTSDGSYTTVEALGAGAVDCFSKERLLGELDERQRREFHARLEAAANANMSAFGVHADMRKPSAALAARVLAEEDGASVQAVVIGCSTGGPGALQRLLPRLPADLGVPVVVVQHMPKGFTRPLAIRMNTLCAVTVMEAEDGAWLRPNTVYVAPAGWQTVLARRQDGVHIVLQDHAPVETRFRPSVDVTLLSAASVYGAGLLAVVLTGMGNDGTLGCREVRRKHGQVLVESEETCVVYGMPKSVFEAGDAHAKLPIDDIAAEVVGRVQSR